MRREHTSVEGALQTVPTWALPRWLPQCIGRIIDERSSNREQHRGCRQAAMVAAVSLRHLFRARTVPLSLPSLECLTPLPGRNGVDLGRDGLPVSLARALAMEGQAPGRHQLYDTHPRARRQELRLRLGTSVRGRRLTS